MRFNRNGIPINRWESVSELNDGNTVYEFSLPPGTIKAFGLDKQINAFAIVQSFRRDYIYVSGNPLGAYKKIQQLCGKRLRYGCTAIPKRKGA